MSEHNVYKSQKINANIEEDDDNKTDENEGNDDKWFQSWVTYFQRRVSFSGRRLSWSQPKQQQQQQLEDEHITTQAQKQDQIVVRSEMLLHQLDQVLDIFQHLESAFQNVQHNPNEAIIQNQACILSLTTFRIACNTLRKENNKTAIELCKLRIAQFILDKFGQSQINLQSHPLFAFLQYIYLSLEKPKMRRIKDLLENGMMEDYKWGQDVIEDGAAQMFVSQHSVDAFHQKSTQNWKQIKQTQDKRLQKWETLKKGNSVSSIVHALNAPAATDHQQFYCVALKAKQIREKNQNGLHHQEDNTISDQLIDNNNNNNNNNNNSEMWDTNERDVEMEDVPKVINHNSYFYLGSYCCCFRRPIPTVVVSEHS